MIEIGYKLLQRRTRAEGSGPLRREGFFEFYKREILPKLAREGSIGDHKRSSKAKKRAAAA